MRQGYAAVGDARLFYRESGAGNLVMFIHAGVADSRMWAPQIEAVPAGFRFVAFDQRGFGKSRLVEGHYSDHLDALALMDHLGAESAVVVGCSMGSAVAVRVAAAAPERVTGLVLVGADSPGFEPSRSYESPEWPAAVSAFAAGDLSRVAQLEAEIWLAGSGRTIDEVDPDLVALFVEMDLTALETETDRDKALRPGPDLLDSLNGLECPMLVVVGSHDLPTLVEAAHDLASKYSGEDAVVITDTAHLPGFERHEVFNSVLFPFLESTVTGV
ncbi:MAG TPA: alpha/beta hydrolase [Acidimicrobiia bacterium]